MSAPYSSYTPLVSPRVDVLVPTYKPSAQHLTESLTRLKNQTETDWHCIICDEPTDVDTRAIVTSFLDDPRFTLERNEQQLGIGGNWNRCFSRSSAPVIAYMFQDDLWEADYLETALKIFDREPSVGFISMNHEYRYDDDLWTVEGYEILQSIKREILKPGKHNGRDFLKMWLERQMHPNLIGEPPFVVLRREVMERVGPFHEDMPQFLDVEYWLRCLVETDWYFEEPMHGQFRIHGAAASFRNNESGTGLYDRLQCYEKIIGLLRGDPLQRVAINSRNRGLEDMAKKFLIRLKGRKTVTTKGGGQVISFALRHPFVMLRALFVVLKRRIFGS